MLEILKQQPPHHSLAIAAAYHFSKTQQLNLVSPRSADSN